MNRFPLTLFSLLAALPLQAEVRTGGGYTILTDVTDAAGGRASAGLYTDEASLGGLTGAASLSSPPLADSAGYIAQIAEPAAAVAAGITITASPLTVNEGGARQLIATLHYGDNTSSPLSAGSVTWSVQSGPLTGISASGLATAAAAVYQDTAAVARGTYQTFTATLNLTVLNTLPDNFDAYAGDGLPDDWQVQYFGTNNPFAGPLLDPDGDGWDNRFEYNACLVPTDRLSAFSFNVTDAPGGGHQVTFSPRLAGCTYSLMGSSDLTLWAPVAGTVTDADTMRTILDPAGTGDRRFYSMEVRRQ